MSPSPNIRISVGDKGILNEAANPELAEIWIDRDLGWLEFNERVLAEALDERTPLLERAKFLAIFSSNLDEFFMKRVAEIRKDRTADGRALLSKVREKLVPALRRQSDCYRNCLIHGLAKHGIHLARWQELSEPQRAEAEQYFEEHVSAALTPLVIDPTHPFPFLSNQSVSIAAMVMDPKHGAAKFARVKVPGVLKQWISLTGHGGSEKVLLPMHELIRGNLDKLYVGMQVSGVTIFRLTRDAEVELDDDSEEALPEQVQEQVRMRRYEPAVRLEFAGCADPAIKQMFIGRCQLEPMDIYEAPELLDYSTLFEIAGLNLPGTHDTPWTPLAPKTFREADPDVFALIRSSDQLVHHPYDNFDVTVEQFVEAAASDPSTVSIKMTLYRMGDHTPIIESLIRAAEAGIQVACLIEIKARFDEQRNLENAAQLEKAGAHVTYGVSGLKTHAKTILVVRKEGGDLKSYVHIGTGNYHVKTARLYADVGLFTCDPQLTRDVVHLFHYLTGFSKVPAYNLLLVAPTTMRPRFLEMIHREIENHKKGLPARIIAKMNQLEDPEIITAVAQASAAGVPIDFVIRGFCSLRPGVPGRTETVRVRSIIGRFLEHSRIFHFAAGQEDPAAGEFYIGSADWMHRNLTGRVEVVTPILSPALKHRLWNILDVCLSDRRQAWVLQPDGSYVQLKPEPGAIGPAALGTHQVFMDQARRAAESD